MKTALEFHTLKNQNRGSKKPETILKAEPMVQTCSETLNRTNERNNFVLLVVSNVIINFSAGFLLLYD